MNKKYLYMLSMGHAGTDINAGALPAILPFFVSEYGMDYTSVAGLLFASSFLSSIIQPLFGYLADKQNRQWFMGLGVLISGLSLAMTGFIKDYWLIFACVTMMGIGNAIFHPEGARNVNKISGKNKGSSMSIFGVGGNIGIGLGPLLAVFLITTFGMRGLFVFGVLSVCAAFMLFIIGGKIRNLTNEIKTAELKNTSPEKNNWPAFGRLFLVILFRSSSFRAITGFLPLFLIQIHLASPSVAGGALTVVSIAGIFASLIGGYISDKKGYVTVVRFCALLLIPCVALIASLDNIYIIYLTLIPLSLAMHGSYSAFIVLGQSYLKKSVGFASGVTLGLSFSIGGIMMPLFGNFADNYGLDSLMYLVVIIAAIGAAVSFLLPNLKTRSNV